MTACDGPDPAPICVPPREWREIAVPDFPPADELRHIVTRLVRLMFGARGCLDDENTAPLSGEAYSREDQQLLRGMFLQGSSLAVIAEALGRTRLGAGWKLLSLQIPTLSAELQEEYAADGR